MTSAPSPIQWSRPRCRRQGPHRDRAPQLPVQRRPTLDLRELHLTSEPAVRRPDGPSGLRQEHPCQASQASTPPDAGVIRIDGRTFAHSQPMIAPLLWPSAQETVLYSGTIYDNLVMANLLASFEDVVAAAEAADIHDVIDSLPNGLSDGDRGARRRPLWRSEATLGNRPSSPQAPKVRFSMKPPVINGRLPIS